DWSGAQRHTGRVPDVSIRDAGEAVDRIRLRLRSARARHSEARGALSGRPAEAERARHADVYTRADQRRARCARVERWRTWGDHMVNRHTKSPRREPAKSAGCENTKRIAGLLVFAVSCAFAVMLRAVPDTITVTGGQIAGSAADGIRAFKGIPFAAPPVGELR